MSKKQGAKPNRKLVLEENSCDSASVFLETRELELGHGSEMLEQPMETGARFKDRPSSNSMKSPRVKRSQPGRSPLASRPPTPLKSPSKAMTTIAEVKEAGSMKDPREKTDVFPKPLVASLVEVSDVEQPRVEFALADTTGSIKVVWYRNSAPNVQEVLECLQPGNGVFVSNFRLAKNHLVLASTSKIRSVRPPPVQPENVEAARLLIRPKESIQADVATVKRNGEKASTLYDLTGEIVAEEVASEVNTRNGLTWVKRITLQDATGKIFLSLWRDLAFHADAVTGNWLSFTYLKAGLFNNGVVVGSTNDTKVQLQDVPMEEMAGEILCVDRIQSPWVYLLMAPTDGEDIVTIRCKEDYLLQTLNVSIAELTGSFPLDVTVNKRGSEVVDITIDSFDA